MPKYYVRVAIQLEFEIEADSAEEAQDIAEDKQLPDDYRSDTFEIIEIQKL